MTLAARVLTLMLMAIIPGGLLVLASWVLARLLVERMRAGAGTQGQRFARAFATIRVRDVMAEARRLV